MSYTGSVPAAPRPADWRDFAACRTEDPELFFPKNTGGPADLIIQQAKAVCRRCPSVDRCLRWALETGQEAGIWGGLTEDERSRMKRRGSRPPAPKPQIETSLVFTQTGTLAEACRDLHARYTDLGEAGHLVWTPSKTGVRIHGSERSYMQICFQAGHGRWPVGRVHRRCRVWRCVAPECLTDNTIRWQEKKQAQAAV